MLVEFALPDVGEGLTEAEIIAWHIVVGDAVAINDTLVEIETAKSIVDLPSPAAGVVVAVHFAVGSTVSVGTVIVSINENSEAGAVLESKAPPEVTGMSAAQVLVGTGPRAAATRRRRLTPPSIPIAQSVSAVVPTIEVTRIRAKPPVRFLARQLGVDLATLTPGPQGVITREEVEASATSATSRATDVERETRVQIKGVRKATAAAVTRSAFTAPHVTEWLAVDLTQTMEMIKRLKADANWVGVRLTPLVFVARAFLLAVRRFPQINATWDEGTNEIVTFSYVNLGIAAATPRGLIVPNIKDCGRMDLPSLANAIRGLVESARSGSTSPEDMARGTITITNIGALGVDAGTPILNPGEAAILALGAIRDMPWVVNGEIVPRAIAQLAISFDHRLVDGELGSQVLVETGRLLRDPGETFLHV